ncbi:PPC domain-containing DNA-binding protein [Haloarcula amylovorans]|uniref:PPC domain-containing DNA-binding protein n=1 Tax=Haloarcula amylovorans TaxID=2562280 RepID=UPI0010769F53|nr:PPC domain-containing DNA-binding protein [Halomicroarcula amylolytica]
MEAFESDDGHIVVRVDTGDDLLKAIKKVCRDEAIETGAVISGIGTLNRLEIHYLHSENLDESTSDRNTVIQSEECWEISGISGTIADKQPHVHLTAFNGDRTVVGHLEEGCIVNALGEIVIRPIEGLSIIRSPNEFGVNVLRPEE